MNISLPDDCRDTDVSPSDALTIRQYLEHQSNAALLPE